MSGGNNLGKGVNSNLESISKNRVIKIALLFCSIALFSFFLMQNQTLVFSEMSLDVNDLITIMASRTYTTKNLFNTIKFNDIPLIIDNTNHYAFYSLAPNVDQPLDFNPIITIDSDEKIKTAFMTNEVSWSSIAENEQIPFIVYSETEYQKLNLVITTLPLVEIELNKKPGDPDVPIQPVETLGKITVIDNQNRTSVLNRYFTSDIEIHRRGGSSRFYPQNSYRLSLLDESPGSNTRKNYSSLLGMDWDDDWILYAPFNDPEKVRNVLSTNLWWEWGATNNAFGMKNGSQAEFVELFIDGRYWGIYALTKPITAKSLNLKSDPDPTKSEYYYRTFSWVETTHEMFVNSSENEVGRYELRYPDIAAPGYENWAPLDRLTQVMQADYDLFSEEIFTLADEQNSIDIWLFVTTVLGFDNGGKNLNFIAKRNGDDYIFYFSPWDLDQTWGMIYTDDPPLLTAVDRYPDDDFMLRMICNRFIDHKSEEIINKIQSRYDEIRATFLSNDQMEQLLSGYEENIFGSGAYLRNQERWSEAAYADNMSDFKNFVFQRLDYMDGYIESISAP